MTLKGDARIWEDEYVGTYQLSTNLVNRKPSWTFIEKKKAIWYITEYNEWGVGILENLGTNVRALSTGRIEDDVDLFDILSDSWSFWDTTNKSFKDGDVTIQCKGN